MPFATGAAFLVVEDDTVLARAMARGLRPYGNVSIAGTVEEARRAVHSERLTGMVLDVMLPDGSGLDLLQELRAAGNRTPALVLTGLHDDELVNRAQRLNAQFAFKPLAPGGVESFVEWTLSLQGEPPSSPAVLSAAREDWRRAPDEQLRRLARAFEAVPVAVLFASADARIELVNEAFCRITGYAPEELRGRDLAMLRPEGADPRLYDQLLAKLSRGESEVREYERRRKDGSVYPARVFISPIVGEHGDVLSHVEVHEDVSARAATRAALRESEARARDLLARLFDAQEEERRRLARDLHDGVGQRLTSLLLGLTRLEHSCDDDELSEQARELREQVRATMDELDAQVRGMHPHALEDFGLVEVMRRMVPEFADLHGLRAELATPGAGERLPRAIETTLYRVLQEALTNISRHADAATVRVELVVKRGTVHLSVEDDGCGFDAQGHAQEGLGLRSIRERAEQHGGRFELHSGPQGTLLHIQLPLGVLSLAEDPHPAR